MHRNLMKLDKSVITTDFRIKMSASLRSKFQPYIAFNSEFNPDVRFPAFGIQIQTLSTTNCVKTVCSGQMKENW